MPLLLTLKICSKFVTKTPQWCRWRCSDVFIANFKHISHLFLAVFWLSTGNCLLGCWCDHSLHPFLTHALVNVLAFFNKYCKILINIKINGNPGAKLARTHFVSNSYIKNQYLLSKLLSLVKMTHEENLRSLTNIYLFKVINISTREKCDICSKLAINDVVLVFLLLTSNIFHTFFQCFHC